MIKDFFSSVSKEKKITFRKAMTFKGEGEPWNNTSWCEVTTIFCVQGALGITPGSLGFTIGPGAPKTVMQVALSINLGHVSTNRQNQSWTNREQMLISCHSHAWMSHRSYSNGLQPNWTLGLEFVLGLSTLGFESVFICLWYQVPGKWTANDLHSNYSASA